MAEKLQAELILEAGKFEAGIKRAEGAMERFQLTSEGAFSRLDSLQASLSRIDFSAAFDGAADAGRQLSELARTGAGLIGGFLGAANEAEKFRLTLGKLEGSAAAGEATFKKLAAFAGTTTFELPGVVQAGVQLRTYGQSVDRFLPLAGDLASVFNRDIPDAAQALGKALSGSQDGLQILQDSFGITKRELLAAGAAMKSGGGIALDTSSDLEKLAKAIEKVAAAKGFTGAQAAQLETLSGRYSQLSDAVTKLQTSLGEALAPSAKVVVDRLTELVNQFNELSPATKELAAKGLAAGTVLLGIGGAALTTGAVIGQGVIGLQKMGEVLGKLPGASGLASRGLGLVRAAAVGLATPLGAVIAVVAAAAVGFHAYTESINENTAQTEAWLKLAERVGSFARDAGKLFGKSAGEIAASGASYEEATRALLVAEQNLELARKEFGDGSEQAQRWEREAANIRAARNEINLAETAHEKAAIAAKANADAYAAAEAEMADAARGRLKDELHVMKVTEQGDEERLAALQRLADRYSFLGEERKALEVEIFQLQQKVDQAAMQRAQERLELEKRAIDLRLAGLRDQAAAGRDVAKQTAQAIKDRAKTEDAAIRNRLKNELAGETNPSARANLEQKAQLDLAEAKQNTERALQALEAEGAARALAALKEQAQLDAERLSLQKDAVDQRIEGLRREQDLGRDVAAELKAAILERQKLAQQAAQKAFEVELADERDPGRRRQLERNFGLQQGNAQAEHQRELEDLEKSAADAARDRALEQLDLEQSIIEMREKGLRDELEAGKSVEAALRQTILDRLALTEEEIRVRAEAARAATEDAREQALIEQQAQGLIAEARRGAKKDIDSITGALEQQKAAQEALEGPGPGDIQTFEQFLEGQASQFGIGATRARIAEQRKNNRANAAPSFPGPGPSGLSLPADPARFAPPKAPTITPDQAARTIGRQPVSLNAKVEVVVSVDPKTGKLLAREEKREVTANGRGSSFEDAAANMSPRGNLGSI